MNQSSQKVISYLTGNKSLDSVSVDDLKTSVLESPFFPINQLLLAKKLKGEDENGYLSQAEKTALYFSNPYWLQTQLEDDYFSKFGDLELITINTKNSNTTVDPADEMVPAKAGNSSNETSSTISANEKIIDKKAVSILPALSNEEATDTTSQAVPENNDKEYDVEGRLPEPKQDVAFVADENEAKPVEEIPERAEPEVVEFEEEMAGAQHDIDLNTRRFLEELQSRPQESEEPEQDDEHDKMFQNIKAMLDASSEEADADTKNAVIAIDPYYTIDYFASQGIKLELDKNPNDQLGQNLKKFTHWLRHMKKLGPEDATELINRTETDADIQQIADSSNTVREVVTEAMASVLEKQGKKDKAIELYNKLSFLNPDKSAYFADQIKKLKGF